MNAIYIEFGDRSCDPYVNLVVYVIQIVLEIIGQIQQKNQLAGRSVHCLFMNDARSDIESGIILQIATNRAIFIDVGYKCLGMLYIICDSIQYTFYNMLRGASSSSYNFRDYYAYTYMKTFYCMYTKTGNHTR